jgi:antitoxin (DNA-binding transcriptional repressor) of toxin-antitoxin stability system
MHLSALVDAAAAGEEIVISKNGVPKARLISIPSRTRKHRHPAGALKLEYLADDFNAPDNVIAAQFEGR